MNFLCARNTTNLKRRDNACHCRLRDCEHVGTYSVSLKRRMAPDGDVTEGPARTSSGSSSRVGDRSRERSSEYDFVPATATDPPHDASMPFSFSLSPLDNRLFFLFLFSSVSLHRLKTVLSLSYEVGSVEMVVDGE